MFSLFTEKMNIVVDNFDITHISPTILATMYCLHKYLDKEWEIYKKHHTYILKRDDCKMLLSDSIKIKSFDLDQEENKTLKYILCFLFNVLNNGWSIKKNKNKYICLKNHEGKKEYFSDNYINTFMKDHFNFNLIK